MNNEVKKHRLRNWLIIVIAIIAVGVLAFWPTNYYIESPGEVVPVNQLSLIHILTNYKSFNFFAIFD